MNKISDLQSYIEGLISGLKAVKNTIQYVYNNGPAEKSVTKLKLIKRIVY